MRKEWITEIVGTAMYKVDVLAVSIHNSYAYKVMYT